MSLNPLRIQQRLSFKISRNFSVLLGDFSGYPRPTVDDIEYVFHVMAQIVPVSTIMKRF
jgi:hypothetical protein